MTEWALLAGAIALEVLGTVGLRTASAGRRIWLFPVAGCYLLSFALLSSALAEGLPLGVAYGVWAAAGVALTAIAGRLVLAEPLTPPIVSGVALVAVGVLLVELGAPT